MIVEILKERNFTHNRLFVCVLVGRVERVVRKQKVLCASLRFCKIWFVEMCSTASSGSLASVVLRYVYVGFYA